MMKYFLSALFLISAISSPSVVCQAPASNQAEAFEVKAVDSTEIVTENLDCTHSILPPSRIDPANIDHETDPPQTDSSSFEPRLFERVDQASLMAEKEPSKKAGDFVPDPVFLKPEEKRDVENLEKFFWKSALVESLYFLGIKTGIRMDETKTRKEFKGPFFRDWFNSVKNLSGWDDHGRFFTNYPGHSMQGAVTGWIFINNSEKSRKLEFGKSKDYWTSRLKAMAWSAAWSAQFELGPISEASLGNVGLYDKIDENKMGWIDIVITPVGGTGFVVLEDVVDKYFVRKYVTKIKSRIWRHILQSVLSPFRAFSNLLHGQYPWKRYNWPPASQARVRPGN